MTSLSSAFQGRLLRRLDGLLEDRASSGVALPVPAGHHTDAGGGAAAALRRKGRRGGAAAGDIQALMYYLRTCFRVPCILIFLFFVFFNKIVVSSLYKAIVELPRNF